MPEMDNFSKKTWDACLLLSEGRKEITSTRGPALHEAGGVQSARATDVSSHGRSGVRGIEKQVTHSSDESLGKAFKCYLYPCPIFWTIATHPLKLQVLKFGSESSYV